MFSVPKPWLLRTHMLFPFARNCLCLSRSQLLYLSIVYLAATQQHMCEHKIIHLRICSVLLWVIIIMNLPTCLPDFSHWICTHVPPPNACICRVWGRAHSLQCRAPSLLSCTVGYVSECPNNVVIKTQHTWMPRMNASALCNHYTGDNTHIHEHTRECPPHVMLMLWYTWRVSATQNATQINKMWTFRCGRVGRTNHQHCKRCAIRRTYLN